MFPLPDETIAALAPTRLASLRQARYTGQGVSVALGTFDRTGARTIRRLYDMLIAVYELLSIQRTSAADHMLALSGAPEMQGWDELLEELRALQVQENTPEAHQLAQAIHDLRGGAFQALSIYMQLIELGGVAPEHITRIFLLTRDHLKIMRNCVPDLDPGRYARDTVKRVHSAKLLVEKWVDARYPLPGMNAQVSLDCRYDGGVSECCLEFAALDRVVYNLMNNATRHAADGRVALAIVPLPGEEPPHLRFVVHNRITEQQRARLRERFGDRLGGLYGGGFTTGGSGIGMQNCAELVANAYGLSWASTAVEGGYIGAALYDQSFVAWFHWPAVAD
ncbi:MAG: hypothetical protein RLZZ387_3607 [Chloroflexota bacterium]